MTLIEDYVEKAVQYIEDYGEKTVLLMQVGTFYEIYSLNDSKSKLFHVIYDIGNITGLSVVEKSICVGSFNVLAAGFRDYSIDKWVQKIHNNGYTCVVYSQDVNGKNTTRSLTGIYTPGTYIHPDENASTGNNNNNTCIWIEKIKSKLCVGIANINVLDGRSQIYEYQTEFTSLPTIYDDIERHVTVYNPVETIIISNLSTSCLDSIIQYTNIQSISIHIINLNDESNHNTKKALRCEQQTYRNELFKTYFHVTNMNVFLEKYTYYELATQTYCYLLNHLYVLNPNLTEKISEPIVDNLSERLILANHSSKQLNILGESKGKHVSILNLTNNTLTSMGNRKHREQLLNPTSNIEYLRRCYDTTDHLMKSGHMNSIRELLTRFHDFDKAIRLIIMGKLPVRGIFTMHKDLMKIRCLCELLSDCDWLESFKIPAHVSKVDRVIKFIEDHVLLNVNNGISMEETFFNRGLFPDLDKLNEQHIDAVDQLNAVVENLDKMMNDKLSPKKSTNYLKLHDTEKSGYSIQITKSRVKPFEEVVKEFGYKQFVWEYTSNYSKETRELLMSSKVKVEKYNNLLNVNNEDINCICKTQLRSKSKLKELFDEKYIEFLASFSPFLQDMYDISSFVANMDILQNRAYIATTYNYCKPTIKEADSSYLDAKNIRHPIIELINQTELYVANDIVLNKDDNILLFGTNAVGKTSLIKSIGIAVVMAQAGMYVPAQTFTYMPYKQIFTRILNCDNLFKGLSTFTLEMSELSNILKYADSNTLVLGDELCSGTELPSAMCIFISGLTSLVKQQSSFIFATHFHELIDFIEIQQLPCLHYKHMTVTYDTELQSIIYDRKLRDGSGEKMYGLEVCKSLYMPSGFMERAFSILNKYYKEDILSQETSRYNSKKIKNVCELCNTNKGEHIHHMLYQRDAVNSIISEPSINSHIPKNHAANLINICDTCHRLIHENDTRLVRKTTTRGTILEEI
jgi:DNA mismatch repair protein MutS